MFTERTV